ncbi:MAG: PDZ domain-containing protein [Planctomycetales bacterium]|nr:PDZ domain-containing protein [Planctomycetales bacterium]
MKNRRWLWAIGPALGLACLCGLGSSVMQAQVGSEPKATTKARPAERATPATEDRAVPAEAPKNAPARGAADETVRKPAPREGDSREHQGGGWLGVYVSEPDEKNPAAGVQISQVFPASPAARAGFRAGDVITQVNEHKVTDPQSFITTIEVMPPGTKAAFAVQRNNQPVKLTATLGQNYWMAHQQDQNFDRNSNGMRGRGHNEEEYPIYALELEHNRRVAEQHERMEQMLLELKEEVRQLREELKAKK